MKKPKKKPPLLLAVHCHQGVCLVYKSEIADRNDDQVSDRDTIAMGANPEDGSVTITGAQIIAALGAGRLDSFNRGQSSVLVLPEIMPNGERVIPKNVASLRSDYLSSAGISRSALAAMSLSTESGFYLQVDKPFGEQVQPTSNGGKIPNARIGRMDAGLFGLDQGEGFIPKYDENAKNPDKVDKTNKPDAGTPPPPKDPPRPKANSYTLDGEGPNATSLSSEEVARVINKVRGEKGQGESEDGGTKPILKNPKDDFGDPPPSPPPPPPPPPPPDGGSYTDGEYQGTIIRLSPKEVAVIAAIRGGDPIRDKPEGPGNGSPLVGGASDSWVILVDPEQGGVAIDKRFSFLISPPKFVDKSPKSSDWGDAIIEGIVPGSGQPRP